MSVRLFTGFELTAQAREEASRLMELEDTAIRWTSPQNLHLTSYFFGNWEEEATENLKACISLLIPAQRRFTLELRDVILAPPKQEARMIWARYHRHPDFLHLSKSLAEMFHQFDPDHPFRKNPIPHITLARLQHWPDTQLFSPEIKPKNWKLACDEMILWRSDQSETGTRYTELGRWSLPQ